MKNTNDATNSHPHHVTQAAENVSTQAIAAPNYQTLIDELKQAHVSTPLQQLTLQLSSGPADSIASGRSMAYLQAFQYYHGLRQTDRQTITGAEEFYHDLIKHFPGNSQNGQLKKVA